MRLFVSYALVVVAGAAVAYLTVRLLAPPLFDHRMAMLDGGQTGQGMGPGMGSRHGSPGACTSAFLSALTTALLVGVLASVAVAGLAAAFVTRRLLRPLDAVRAATRLIAAGHYQASVPLPSEPELAALAADVNTLATALAGTETRRTRLLGEVAHEMRTPLTALDGYMEGLIDGVFAPEPEILGAASDELRRLRRLADDLSALSRAEEQRLDLHLADADLADLARRAAGRLAPQFADDHVLLTVDAPRPAAGAGRPGPDHPGPHQHHRQRARSRHLRRAPSPSRRARPDSGPRPWSPTPGSAWPPRTWSACSSGSTVRPGSRAAPAARASD